MGRKFKIRDNNGEPYVYIKDGRAQPNLKIVDEDDRDFKAQAYKFESEPCGEADAKAATQQKVANAFTEELKTVEHMKRDDLVSLYTSIKGGAPPEGATKQLLLAVLVEVRAGKSMADAEKAATEALAAGAAK